MSCRCPKTIAFLQSIGAVYAAQMHQTPDAAWSSLDWLRHMAEEEQFLLPILPADIARKIYEDHVLFRDEIARYGVIRSSTVAHSELEDAWIGVLTTQRG